MARVTTRSTIEGGGELLKALRRQEKNVGDVLETAVKAGAQLVAQVASGYAPEPVITTDTVKKSKKLVIVDSGPPDDKWYWKYLETGAQPHEIPGPLVIEFDGILHRVGGASHPGITAQPFMRPAFDGQSKRAVNVVGKELRKAVEK
jgi:HK97 gp10 family phage protein